MRWYGGRCGACPRRNWRRSRKALTAWGGLDEFRYFAPRLLEPAADDAFGWPDPEIVFGELGLVPWRDWPQRDAVTTFLDAFWRRMLETFPARPAAGAALCAIAAASGDVTLQLAIWARLDAEAAVRHLHTFVTNELTWWNGRPHLGNAYWDETGPAYRRSSPGSLTGPPQPPSGRRSTAPTPRTCCNCSPTPTGGCARNPPSPGAGEQHMKLPRGQGCS
ncbi:hypothetical protein [Thermomonospora cellulosilytica]|uniref:Uncharacterized protein n=1 Tax=Thermomonospora cellulosilytica TaxID=1411118 RepID=A0A7W3R8D8_9ACTN|nr:hypothetical protein [Thermomonospora cellulosilytica]MBA9004228.1 hypothetical protein [Thermomonospora cellulosilytica]